MKKKRIGDSQCPIARGLERVGEWWSILILRDALHGYTRFDPFRESLGIAPNMLARRLASLVKSGLLERRLYNQRPPRYDYVLTERLSGKPLTDKDYVLRPGPAAKARTRERYAAG